jgi:hypothetical protein
MILSRLTLSFGVLAVGGMIGAAVLTLTGPALAVSDGYEAKVQEEVFCTLFDNPVALRRFEVAYSKIKRATGQDPTVAEARAAAGLGKDFCLED